MRSGRQKPAKTRKPKPAAKKRPSPDPAPKQQGPAGPAADQPASQSADLTPFQVLRLQHELGNQAVNRLLAKGHSPAAPATAPSALLPAGPAAWPTTPAAVRLQDAPPLVQRLLTSKNLDKRLDGYYDEEDHKVGVEASTYRKLKLALDQYHDYDKEFKKLKPDYLDHTLRLEMIRQVIGEAEKLLGMLKFTLGDRKGIIKKVHSEAIDAFTKASPNARRAKVARKELQAKKALDKNPSPRLTDDLIEMMVMSVASPIDELDIKGQAGHLGINTANNAADALIMMQQKDFDNIKSLLEKSGDDFGEVAKKATLLKAVAARKNDLIAGGPQSAMQMFVLELFAGIIRGMDQDVMIEATHVADRGSDEGLQQRYTTSCGPTSIEIVQGEFDPIYAFGLSGDDRKSLSEGDLAAAEQKRILESYRGKDTAVPRDVQKDWDTLIAAVNTYYASATWKQKLHIRRVVSYLSGRAGLSRLTKPGIKILKSLGTGVDIDKRLPEFRRLYAVLGKAPGMTNAQFAKAAEEEMGDDSGREFKETAIKYKEKMIRGKKELRGNINKHFKKLNKALFRGDSVPFGVMWNTGGGHFMVFIDMRQEKKGKKTRRYYLVSDPWHGKSVWMSSTDLSKGKFTMIGLPQGAIDSIYL
jgi:hypothetical protein